MKIGNFARAVALTVILGASPANAKNGEWLRAEIERSKAGATIEVPEGDYDLTDFKIGKSLSLRGAANGKTVFRSAATTEKGILVPLSGVDLRLENITFSGAKAWDRNGAGVRHEGRNLTIVNCRFLHNEDGILATGDASGVITIERSAFISNGFGDGMSHAIYISTGARLDVVGSRFVSTRIGHHVKSLADATTVKDSVLDDGVGRSSYSIDVSKGGDVVIENNTIVQAADAENYAIVNYDLSRGGKATRLVLRGNKVVNRFRGGVFLRNDTKLAPVMSGNAIENAGGRPLSVTSPGSPPPLEQ